MTGEFEKGLRRLAGFLQNDSSDGESLADEHRRFVATLKSELLPLLIEARMASEKCEHPHLEAEIDKWRGAAQPTAKGDEANV